MKDWLARLYPRAWRRRYGAEFAALLEQQSFTPGLVLDVARGALDAHRMARRQRRTQAAQIQPGSGKDFVMKRGRHHTSCSFCGKPEDKGRRLIAGPGVTICNECVTLCNEIIAEEEHLPPTSPAQNQGPTARYRRIPWWRRLLGRRHRALPPGTPRCRLPPRSWSGPGWGGRPHADRRRAPGHTTKRPGLAGGSDNVGNEDTPQTVGAWLPPKPRIAADARA